MLSIEVRFSALAWVFTAACSHPEPPTKPTLRSPSPSSSFSVGPRVAAIDECAASDGCRESGACQLIESVCRPTQLSHCLQSVGCQRDGRCRLSNDRGETRCGSETHGDCASSTRCRTEGRCFVSSGDWGGNSSCISTKPRVVQRLPLTEKRHGLRGELSVLVDSRLPASALRDARGYLQLSEEPIAKSSVRLQSADGSLLDELALYPAVDVAARSLGSATDTFLATEHVACVAGRFCGWHIRFFELADGKIQLLRALGPAGAPRQIETTASFAARWTLKRNAKIGTYDILSQEEDPEKIAWVERRFFYADKSWRFSEREAPLNDPQMLAEPGSWAGQLD